MSSSLPSSKRSLLPDRQERVVIVNILLGLAVPLLAYLLNLLVVSYGEEVDFLLEGGLAIVVYVAVAFGLWQLWRRGRDRDTFRVRAVRAVAALDRWQAVFARTVRTRPLAAIWTTALLGVLVSCYPVVFASRSFVSPNSVEQLVYNHAPTVPGMKGKKFLFNQGSDTGAMMWQNLPYTVLEHRAIFQDHELPVWNRYDAGGLTMIGQGQSMIGDPLNLVVMLLGGDLSWAWDVRFLLARLLFAAGVGLCVRAATRRMGGTLVLTFSACFLGYFIYRLNHPAQFAVCYAPWVLLPWLWVVGEPDRDERTLRRQRWGWAFVLLAACWCVFCSGAVKEPVVLLLSLNAAGGLLVLLDECGSWRWKRQRLVQAAWAGGCFVLLSAPLWRTFLDALPQAWTSYEKSVAYQLQPGLMLGLFDDIFTRQFMLFERVLDPSLNFAVLLGVLFAAASCRVLVARSRVFLAVGLAALGAVLVVFGVVSPWIIRQLPFFSKIQHIDNTFSCPLMVLVPVLAGFGLERCRELLRRPRFVAHYGAVVAGILILWGAFLGLAQAGQRSNLLPFSSTEEVPLSAFFFGYTTTLLVAILAIPLLLRWWRQAGTVAGFGVLPALLVCWAALLWRGGLYTQVTSGWERYVVTPGERVDLRTSSPALDCLVAADARNPGVCLGMDHNLMGGYMALFGLETVLTVNALQNPYYHDLDRHESVPEMNALLAGENGRPSTPRLAYYDLLGVRYYGVSVLPGATAGGRIGGLRLLGHYDLDVYESLTAWPRAFFTDSYVPCQRITDVFRALGREGGRPFAAVAPADIEAGAGNGAPLGVSRGEGDDAGRAIVPATDYRRTSRTTSFHLNTPGGGLIVLGEGYHAAGDTRVYLDGRLVPHFRTNWAFTGFRVATAGVHEVRVVYGPQNLPMLLWVCVSGVILVAATAWLVWKPRMSAQRTATGEQTAPAGNGGALAPGVTA